MRDTETIATLTARLALAERALIAKDKTIQALVKREKDRAAGKRSSFDAVEESAILQRVVAEKTRKLAEQNRKLATTQRDLMEASRQAGMAEVATSVLHNVGNVLNSVNVCSSCAADTLRKSQAGKLIKVAALLREHEAQLESFFATDPRARQLPGYLTQLADHIRESHHRTLQELADLQKHIDHIKDVVALQQNFAKAGGLIEPHDIQGIVEEALHMSESSLLRHDIQLVREFTSNSIVPIEKHKLLQILVNLISNAKQACDEAGRDEKQITLRVLNEAGRVCISVTDNGVGIPPENLDRIFNHGFTTKKNGHGFGLHSGANAAREMGGHLHVHSDGLGCGATFTLELPLANQEKFHA